MKISLRRETQHGPMRLRPDLSCIWNIMVDKNSINWVYFMCGRGHLCFDDEFGALLDLTRDIAIYLKLDRLKESRP